MQDLKTGFVLHGNKDYTIQNVLGHGGCGILYHATSKVMDGNIEQIHEYAIKEYFDKDCCRRGNNGMVEFTDDSEEMREIRDNFRAEATCLKNLKYHRNIVQVNEVFAENGTFYYVMEFLKGKTLRQKVTEKLSEKEALKYIADIADALDYLHSEHINHLDVKPDNIMIIGVGDDMRAVLIDFGLSKHFNKSGKLKGKQGYDGASKGYAPKEQYDIIDEFSPQSDVYALGATLFFLLTGTDPCSGKEITPKYIWSHLPDNISDRVANALVKAMNADKDDRTQSIKEFYQNLFEEQSSKHNGVPTEKIRKRKKGNIGKSNDDKIKKFAVYGIIALVVLGLIYVSSLMRSPGQKKAVIVDSTRVDTVQVVSPTKADLQSDKNETGQSQPETQNTEINRKSEKAEEQQTLVQPERKTLTSGTLDLGYAVWKGGIKNGKPDGVGKMTFKRSHRLDSETIANAGDVFDGIYTDGHIDGGKLFRTDGEVITIIGEN